MSPGDFVNDTTTALITPLPAPPAPATATRTTTTTTTTSGPVTGNGSHNKNNNNNNNKTTADYLAQFPHLTDLDKRILAQPADDSRFTPHSWRDLRALLAANALHLLTRSPSQTRAYLDWSLDVRARHGSLTDYLLRERLHWTPSANDAHSGIAFDCADATPFANAADVRVLRNDWPYGLDEGIAHVCVWVKTPLEVVEVGGGGEGAGGDLTAEARARVEAYVTETFRVPLGEGEAEADRGERVLWFKNWAALQSVRGVDHVHVLLRDAPPELLERWMN
ncbi:uncharacterized protein BKCO1_3900047 [Diplodia corticola]|uniref:N-acetylglucosamine-induced protein 1 n=1 Tax=Diplodia corticola TaxID=236234 RepID=A0A1J9QW80_9PEZI|nr:uncharacterized protein BKCO1_3900047 [Diplodia corticola]OJD32258.1 hypothetical protein BKCO1_3900047 [Diplodia corticola]